MKASIEKPAAGGDAHENENTQQGEMVAIDKIMLLLEQHLGSTSEIVYHDLSMPYDHTIKDIRNGEITGRVVGGCGSNLGLEVMRGTVANGDKFNYITHTKNGRILRSSTVYLYEEGKLSGCICVNTDISDSVRFENFLKAYNGYSVNGEGQGQTESDEHFAQNVTELLDIFIQEAQASVGVPAPLMSKEERLRFLEFIDKKGAFMITKSSERVCEFLGISKFTLYNYLETTRNGSPNGVNK